MGAGGFAPPPQVSPGINLHHFIFKMITNIHILMGGVFVRGFCEKSSWIFEFLVVVRATFSVGQRIWV